MPFNAAQKVYDAIPDPVRKIAAKMAGLGRRHSHHRRHRRKRSDRGDNNRCVRSDGRQHV